MALAFNGKGGGGGSQPLVSCLLARDAALDIRNGGAEIKWDALYNNAYDFTPLAAIPTGLGLAFVFDGSSAVITTTEEGTWAFAFQANRSADPTWQGGYNAIGLSRGTGWPSSVSSGSESFVTTDVLTLPSGVSITPTIVESTAATANPYEASAYLSIVRLG